jgi:cyclophilin family peptidyl-prolyl cis-trans isomerase
MEDYDPVVAERVAEILTGWTGEKVHASSRRLTPIPPPGPGLLARYARSRVVLEMEDGSIVRLALRPYLAPTNVHRLVQLASSGRLDGLAFHRIAPNFVVQGAGPGSNEYAGHGRYTRDEVGIAANLRGSMGLSTRGRDTGDGQIYINLVDNLRLDHMYTVLGSVVDGMDAVDRMTEGAVIRRAWVESMDSRGG